MDGLTLAVAALAVVAAGGWIVAERGGRQCRKALRDMAYRQRTEDGVTGVFNADYFTKMAHIQIRLAHRHKWPVTLLVIDLEHLEKLNRQFSFKAGDEALRLTGAAIRGVIRESDIVGREGGRFYLLMPECAESSVEAVWHRILEALVQIDFVWGGEHYTLSWHGGAATLYGVHAKLSTMRRLAEKALEEARRQNRLVVVDQNGTPLSSTGV